MYITGVIIDLILKKYLWHMQTASLCTCIVSVESADLAKKITLHCVVFIKNCISVNRLCSNRAGPRRPEYGGWGGDIESQRDYVSGVSPKGESMRGGFPLSYWKNLGYCGAGGMSGFKLNFESQFGILYAIFCFNFSLYWCCS